MYKTKPNLTLGFHGCDKSLVDDLVNSRTSLNPSENLYDWLGHGMYFWENSPARALAFAQESMLRPHSKIKSPALIGAVLDLGYCLDLLDIDHLKSIKQTHKFLIETMDSVEIPTNKKAIGTEDLLLRNLDCAVIQTLHKNRKDASLRAFDSVRGVFVEGDELYTNAGFKEKNHIQICVRNPNCIKGFFIPRKRNAAYKSV